eukprot:CAMPEP_0185033048 /NCGR_PEP_ID=MMETSP1103-20130426/21675_1 /TAXON_ID=36769 /ORGANISM="Paraphysomonas bandaiensis, Strain Caron Lab Isolate" /LENGTH=30 /DNA_ID= /DNA_START= /DNA_END= /DNA_ORIENTATION=
MVGTYDLEVTLRKRRDCEIRINVAQWEWVI